LHWLLFFFFLAERFSPEKPRDVKIDIEDGSIEDGRRRRAHSPAGSDKRKSAASRSTTEATTITDQEDAQSVLPLCTVFGVVILPRVKLLASIGGLILETEIRDMSVSLSRIEETDKEGEGLKLLFLFCKITSLSLSFFLGGGGVKLIRSGACGVLSHISYDMYHPSPQKVW